MSADGTVYTFSLQDGVAFHDGQPSTSADVVWSLEALSAEDGAGAEDLASIVSITAPDDLTVELTIEQPDNDLLFNLTRRLPALCWQANATGLENTAIGTGPFVFEEWNTGTSISLGVNAEYWGEVPSIVGVTFLYFTDPNAAVNAFTTGDADILTGVNSDLVGPLQDNPDYVVNEGTTNGEFTLGFNNSREPLSNHDVRLAIGQVIGPILWIILAVVAIGLLVDFSGNLTGGYREVPTSQVVSLINGNDPLTEVKMIDKEQEIQVTTKGDHPAEVQGHLGRHPEPGV